MAQNPVVTITMETGAVMKAELYPEIAPVSVNNFISLINKKFYDGLIFHRVIRGFMIQGGCPNGTGMGGPGYTIPGEFSQNGFANDLKHTEGVLSMARAMSVAAPMMPHSRSTRRLPHTGPTVRQRPLSIPDSMPKVPDCFMIRSPLAMTHPSPFPTSSISSSAGLFTTWAIISPP